MRFAALAASLCLILAIGFKFTLAGGAENEELTSRHAPKVTGESQPDLLLDRPQSPTPEGAPRRIAADQSRDQSSATCVLVTGAERQVVTRGLVTIGPEAEAVALVIQDGVVSWRPALDGSRVLSAQADDGAVRPVGECVLRDGAELQFQPVETQILSVLDTTNRELVGSFRITFDGVTHEGSGELELPSQRGWAEVEVEADGYVQSTALVDRSRPEVTLWVEPAAWVRVHLGDELMRAAAKPGAVHILELHSAGGAGDAGIVTGREPHYEFPVAAGKSWTARISRKTGDSKVVIASKTVEPAPGELVEVAFGGQQVGAFGQLRVELFPPSHLDVEECLVRVRSTGDPLDQVGELVAEVRGKDFQSTQDGSWFADVDPVPLGDIHVEETRTGARSMASISPGETSMALLDLGASVISDLSLGGGCGEHAGVLIWSYLEDAPEQSRRVALEQGTDSVTMVTLPKDIRYRIVRGPCAFSGELPCSLGGQSATAQLVERQNHKERMLELRSVEGALPTGPRVWYGLRIEDAGGGVVDVPRRYGGWDASRPLSAGGRGRDGTICFASLAPGRYSLHNRSNEALVASFTVEPSSQYIPVFVRDPALLAGL